MLLVFWTLAFMQVNFRLIVVTKEKWYNNVTSAATSAGLGLYVAQYLLTCGVFVLGLRAPGLTPTHQYANLPPPREPQESRNTDTRSASDGSTWRNFWRKLGRLLPYMWPTNSPLLQLQVSPQIFLFFHSNIFQLKMFFQLFLCFLLLAGMRVTNVFVPIYYKKIVDALSSSGLQMELAVWPWSQVVVWVVLKALQGGGMGQGLLNNARSLLWIKIQQFITRETQVGLFQHLHNLSLRWHMSRKTGEVLRVMDRGTGSINNLMSYLVFNIFPTIADVIIAIVYFSIAFNIWYE